MPASLASSTTSRLLLAGAFIHDNGSGDTFWNVLASASATFDIFTIAGAVEAAMATTDDHPELGVSGFSSRLKSPKAFRLNLGGRWTDECRQLG